MKTKLKIVSMLAGVVLLAGAGISAPAAVEVFPIKSNKNKSWVQYSLKLSGDWKISPKDPLYCYMKRPSGSTRKMTMFENRYFGVISQKVSEGGTRLDATIKALPTKSLVIQISEKKAVTYIVISGRKAILKEIFLFEGKGMLGGGSYAEISGSDAENGKPLIERIKK